jgi:hypothetical protein
MTVRARTAMAFRAFMVAKAMRTMGAAVIDMQSGGRIAMVPCDYDLAIILRFSETLPPWLIL